MAGFSTRAIRAIESFATTLGLQPEPAADGSYSFVFSRSGTLSLVPLDDGRRVLACLGRIPDRVDMAVERQFLALADFDPNTSTFLHAGKADNGTMVLALELDEADFDVQALDAVLRKLIDLQDAVLR